MEAFITFLLVFVIVAVATDERANVGVASTSTGFALVAAVLIGGPSTGGAANPVRALAPVIVSFDLTSAWVHLTAPLVGGVAAAPLYDRVVARASAPAVGDWDRLPGTAPAGARPEVTAGGW